MENINALRLIVRMHHNNLAERLGALRLGDDKFRCSDGAGDRHESREEEIAAVDAERDIGNEDGPV